MNRFVLPIITLGVSLAPVLSWAAEPKAEEVKAIAGNLEIAKHNVEVARRISNRLTESGRLGHHYSLIISFLDGTATLSGRVSSHEQIDWLQPLDRVRLRNLG